MKKIFLTLFLLSACALTGGVASVTAADKTPAAKTAAKKGKGGGSYAKFKARKGMSAKSSASMTLYRDKNKLWLEIPDSLLGRKIMISTTMTASEGDYRSGGQIVSENVIYQLFREDTLLVLKAPAVRPQAEDGDTAQARALARSATQTVLKVLPIKYRGAKGPYVIDATKLLSPSDKKVVQLKRAVIDRHMIYSGTYKPELYRFKQLKAFPSAVGYAYEASYDIVIVDAESGRGSADEKYKFTGEFLTSVTLLPDGNAFKGRVADKRIGCIEQPFRSFGTQRGQKTEAWAVRWDLLGGKRIRVYLDTLLSPSWRQAVKEGLEAWNPAFRRIGLGNAVHVYDYPRHSTTFDADDPGISKVMLCGGHTRISASTRTGEQGERLGFIIQIPERFREIVWEKGSTQIADVDERFCHPEIADDAVCDYLKAEVMRLFGTVLGVRPNPAASVAFTPAQLRSPAFTRAHGFKASVTAGPVFNYMARPGDRARKVVLIPNKIGPYDYHAIEFLYRPFETPEAEKAGLDSLLRSKEGDPWYFFGENLSNMDPRCAGLRLGTDPFAAWEAAQSHLRYVGAHGHEWLREWDAFKDGQNLSNLYIERLFLIQASQWRNILGCLIGGVASNDIRPGARMPRFSFPSKEEQKKALRALFEEAQDFSWLDTNKAFRQMSGMNRPFKDLTEANLIRYFGLAGRLQIVAIAERLGNPYPVSEFLDDVEKEVFKNVRQGRLDEIEDMKISMYLGFMLAAHSPEMSAHYRSATRSGAGKKLTEGNDMDLADQLRIDTRRYPVEFTSDLDGLCYRKMKDALRILKEGQARAKDSITKGKIGFLVSNAEAYLGLRNKN